VWQVALNRDGSRLAAEGCRRSADGLVRQVKVWDTATGALLLTVPLSRVAYPPDKPLPKLRVGGLALSPDGGQLVFDAPTAESLPAGIAVPGFGVRVWDVAARREQILLSGHEERVFALAFSPDGQRIASTGTTGQFLLWDVASGRLLHELRTSEPFYALAFHPHGRRLAGASRNLVQLWDTETGQDVLTLRGAPLRSSDNGFNPRVAFSPDGNWLAASNWNDTVSVWDARPRTEAVRAERLQILVGRTHESVGP
jgi:WD40 repeat protein